MDKCIKVESLCGFAESSFFHSPNPVKGAAALAHYEGIAQMITGQGVVCAIMDTMMVAMKSMNERMLEQMRREEETVRRKESQQGGETPVS